VNGNASTLMDPRGDWLAAYWISRVLDLDDTTKNLSPYARPPVPYALGDGGVEGGASATGDSSSGCGCRAARQGGTSGGLASLIALAALGVARRRRASQGSRRRRDGERPLDYLGPGSRP
jgi:MYXO-CTERM domain-containing protein